METVSHESAENPHPQHKLPNPIWYLCCPVCRRRYPVNLALRKWRTDYSLIDYPVQTGISLGCRGFSVIDYVGWQRVRTLPFQVNETLQIFLRRIENTYWYLKELHLLSLDDYVDAYASKDDFVVAYGLREAK